jgi:hypothetical protein
MTAHREGWPVRYPHSDGLDCWFCGRLVRTQSRQTSSPAFHVRDVPVSQFSVSERLSDRGNVDTETPLLDDDIRPGVTNELVLCYDFAGTLDEMDQNIERTTTEERHEPVAPKDSFAA